MRIRSCITSLLVILLAGCGSDPGFDEETVFIRTEGAVQFVNMMPDSPEVTVLHGLTQTLVKFPEASSIESRFVDKYDWRIAYLDSNNDEVDVVPEQEDQQLAENMLQTFLIMGTVDIPNIQIVDLDLTSVAALQPGEADLWFASNLSNFATVDIYVTDFGTPLSESAPLIAVESGGFTPIFTVPAGEAKQVRITVAGTTELLFDSGSIEIPEQSRDLMALVDDFGPSGANHVDLMRTITVGRTTIADQSQTASVRIANLSTSQPVDATVGSVTATGLNRGDSSVYSQSPAGTQAVSVTGASGSLLDDSATVPAGQFSSLVLFDDGQSPAGMTAQFITDEFRLVQDRALFQIVNGGSEAIDIYALTSGRDTDNTAPTFNDVGFAASGTVEVQTGSIRILVTGANDIDEKDSALIDMIEGQTYTLVFDTQEELHVLIN